MIMRKPEDGDPTPKLLKQQRTLLSYEHLRVAIRTACARTDYRPRSPSAKRRRPRPGDRCTWGGIEGVNGLALGRRDYENAISNGHPPANWQVAVSLRVKKDAEPCVYRKPAWPPLLVGSAPFR